MPGGRERPPPGARSYRSVVKARPEQPEDLSAIRGLHLAAFGDHGSTHAFLVGVHLDLIDRHTAAIGEITARIEVMMKPFRGFRI